jgi:hypothetical protein
MCGVDAALTSNIAGDFEEGFRIVDNSSPTKGLS